MNKEEEMGLTNKIQMLLDKLPNFYVNHTQESIEARKVLKKANVYVFTFPTDNVIRPELQVGCRIYRGIDEIKSYINTIKK